MDKTIVDDMWDKFLESKKIGEPDKSIKKNLIAHYYELVKNAANRMHQRLAVSEVQPDELASMGIDGLYDAIDHYDRSFNTKFETYAMYRIRGSMLDAIRKADWVPRLVRAKCSWLEKQRQILESDAGRKLSNYELAEKLNQNEEDFEHLVKSSSAPSMHSVNDLKEDEDDVGMSIDQVEDHKRSQPIDRMLRQEVFCKLMGRNFTPQERKIIWLYYFEDRSMKEIAEMVELSESRVSQMHSKILERLRQRAELNPQYFDDIWSIIPQFKGMADLVL